MTKKTTQRIKPCLVHGRMKNKLKSYRCSKHNLVWWNPMDSTKFITSPLRDHHKCNDRWGNCRLTCYSISASPYFCLLTISSSSCTRCQQHFFRILSTDWSTNDSLQVFFKSVENYWKFVHYVVLEKIVEPWVY